MKKRRGILILLWIAFCIICHTLSFEESDISIIAYYLGDDMFKVGFALILYSIRNKIKISFLSPRKSNRVYLTLLIYTLWVLIVDSLILMNIGAHDTAIYTQIDIAILSISVLWICV